MSKKSPYGSNIKDFEVGNKIGYGGFAEVFKARCLLPGLESTYVAIKKISKKRAQEQRCKDKIENEIKIHSHLPSHPAFVKYYTSFEDAKYWYLVLELCAGGSFEEYLKRKHRLSEQEAAKLIKQVISGVQCLHFNLIIHRDLTLRNLLLTENFQVKIADFGLAVKLNRHDDKIHTVLGTANYMSPEVFNHDAYDFKTDCWSIGIVLYALLYGSLPFNDKKREYIRESVKYSPPLFPDYASCEAKGLLIAMLNKNPNERIGFPDVLKCPFFLKFEKSGGKNEINSQKSGDSGMSSLSACGSVKLQFVHKTSRYCDSYTLLQKERKKRCVKNIPAVEYYNQNVYDNTQFEKQCSGNILDRQTPEYCLPMLKNSQNYPSSLNQMKTKIGSLPSRFESEIDTPIKIRPECPSYPAELQILRERNFNSYAYLSDQNSTDNGNYSRQNSHMHSNTCRQTSCLSTKDFHDNILRDYSCSHDQYCAPDYNCNHKITCCCQSNKINTYLPIENCTNESPAAKKCLIDIVTPLNTARLNARRKEIEKKDVIISILSDGQVCLEYLKLKRNKKYVHLAYYISEDGLEITIFRPKKKIPLNSDKPPPLSGKDEEIQFFTIENLPNTYWKKYQFAKYFVDKVRGITPKVTIYGEHAACIMMENSPNTNYEMNFYNGFQITEVGNKQTITDENGCNVNMRDNVHFMLGEFADMKEKCRMLEKNIETYHNSNFPVTLGKKPDVNKRNRSQVLSKENISPSHVSSPPLNGLVTGMKSCNITIDGSSSPFPYQNSCQRSTSNANSSEKNDTSSKIVADILPNLKSLEVIDGSIVVEYKDGIQMCISTEDGAILFHDTHNQTELSSSQHAHLMDRFNRDSRNIYRCALLKEVKRKT